jgi:hypothetical protein
LARHESGVCAHLVGTPKPLRVGEVNRDHFCSARPDAGDRQKQPDSVITLGQTVEAGLGKVDLLLQGTKPVE